MGESVNPDPRQQPGEQPPTSGDEMLRRATDGAESQMDDWVQVGAHWFRKPLVPTEADLEQAEAFVFGSSIFEELDEAERGRNVIRLSMNSAADDNLEAQGLGREEGAQRVQDVPMLGGLTVRVTSVRHEGTPVRSFEILKDGEV